MISSELREKARKDLNGKWKKATTATLVYLAITILVEGILIKYTFFLSVIFSLFFAIITPAITYGIKSVFYNLKNGKDIEYFDFIKIGFKNFGRSWGIVWEIIKKMALYIILYIIICLVLVFAGFGTVMSGMIAGTTAMSGAAFYAAMSSAGFSIGLLVICSIATIVLSVFAIIKGLLYTLSTYIAIDKPNLSPKEAVTESEKIMNGNREKYFCLMISFIGWLLLSGIIGEILRSAVENLKLVYLNNFVAQIGMIFLMPYIVFTTIEFYEENVGKDLHN